MPRTASFRKIRALLGDKAPELARALGGPLAGAAADIVAETLLGRRESNESVLSEALQEASPEVLVQLRKASLAFQSELTAAAVEAERVAAGDRSDARARERALKDRVPGALALCVVTGFFGVLSVMLFSDVPSGAETEFSIMLGALATMAAAVMNYYFGSSAGSREKTYLLQERPTASPFAPSSTRR